MLKPSSVSTHTTSQAMQPAEVQQVRARRPDSLARDIPSALASLRTNAHAKALVVGYSPTGSGHTSRLLKIVETALDNHSLPEGSTVVFNVPEKWQGGDRPPYLEDLSAKLNSKGVNVVVAEAEKSVIGYLNADGTSNDAAILNHIAHLPLRPDPGTNSIHGCKLYEGKETVKWNNLTSISAKNLMNSMRAAIDEGPMRDKVMVLTDMDPALMKAALEAGVPPGHILDQQNHGILLNRRERYLNSVPKNAVLAKVLGGRGTLVSHIALGAKNPFADMTEAADLLHLNGATSKAEALKEVSKWIMKEGNELTFRPGEPVEGFLRHPGLQDPADVQNIIYVYAHKSQPRIASLVQSKITELNTDTDSDTDTRASSDTETKEDTAGMASADADVSAEARPRKRARTEATAAADAKEDSDTETSSDAEEVASRAASEKAEAREIYNSTLFVFCGKLALSKRDKDGIYQPGDGNAMRLASLADGDAITTAGAGTVGEFAYMAKRGGCQADLMLIPIPGHDEQKANAEAMARDRALPGRVINVMDPRLLARDLNMFIVSRGSTAFQRKYQEGNLKPLLDAVNQESFVDQAHNMLFQPGGTSSTREAEEIGRDYSEAEAEMRRAAVTDVNRKYIKLVFQVLGKVEENLGNLDPIKDFTVMYKKDDDGRREDSVTFASFHEFAATLRNEEQLQAALRSTIPVSNANLLVLDETRNQIDALLRTPPRTSEEIERARKDIELLRERFGHEYTTGF